MGGAVVVRTCPLLLECKYRVGGVSVLDVVEGVYHKSMPLHALAIHNLSTYFITSSTGSAIEALPHMPMILNSRPEGFDSVDDAIDWQ